MKPLLAELHAHTTWSDGELSVPALVDLYGRNRFDVICVTDHTVRSDEGNRFVGVHNWRAYLDELRAETLRAQRRYGLLIIPGLELTDDHADPLRAAHALAIGLHRFVSVELGIRTAVDDARCAGAAIVAAHPHAPGEWTRNVPLVAGARRAHPPPRSLRALQSLRRLRVDRRARPAVVATGDFHRETHLSTWKTLLPCARDEGTVVAFLRSGARAYLMPFSAAASPDAERIAA